MSVAGQCYAEATEYQTHLHVQNCVGCLQAERWGSELLTEDVEHVDLSVRPFVIRTSETEVQLLAS